MKDFDPEAFLFFALNHFGIQVNSTDGKMVYLEKGYAIEIENTNLFKLVHKGQLVSLFDNAEEMCSFIRRDLGPNEED